MWYHAAAVRDRFNTQRKRVLRRALTHLLVVAAVSLAATVSLRPAWALDQTTEDLSASVEVEPVFRLSVSNDHLAFEEVDPG